MNNNFKILKDTIVLIRGNTGITAPNKMINEVNNLALQQTII